MNETRFAVLVGMNKYKENPLDYSVKDVHDVRDLLISHCRFEKENIIIIDSSDTPVITQVENAFQTIGQKFRKGSDLLLFYYSGHGEYDTEEEKSLLLFEDKTSLEIGSVVMQFFEPLRAKNNYLIVDACHSGKKVFIKAKHNRRKMERKLVNDSKELYFLFAAEENEKAFQDEKLKNSYFTFYFLEAVRNEQLYGEEGWLSMPVIDDYIRKKLSTIKTVVQIPGSESRTIGYKPFAFLEKKILIDNKISPAKQEPKMENNNDEFDLGQSMTLENREKIQNQLKALFHTCIEAFELGELSSTHKLEKKTDYVYLPSELEQKLERSIIETARREDLEAINDLFQVTQVKQNRKKTGLSAMFDIIHGDPEPVTYHKIRHHDSHITAAFIELEALSHQNATGGLYCLFYQAKYGFVFCKTFFKYVWNGASEKISNFVSVKLTPYRLTEQSVALAKGELDAALQELLEKIKKWNVERKSEIDSFLKKAK